MKTRLRKSSAPEARAGAGEGTGAAAGVCATLTLTASGRGGVAGVSDFLRKKLNIADHCAVIEDCAGRDI
jgi:hypothetical protein